MPLVENIVESPEKQVKSKSEVLSDIIEILVILPLSILVFYFVTITLGEWDISYYYFSY